MKTYVDFVNTNKIFAREVFFLHGNVANKILLLIII